MEVFIPCNTSTRDLSHKAGSSVDPHNSSRCNSRDLNMNELKTCLAEFYQIQDTRVSMSGFCTSPERKALSHGWIEDEYKNSNCIRKTSASDKFFSKYTPFSPLGEPITCLEESFNGTKKQGSDLTAEISEVNNQSVPISPNLVSAMKGSREKQGIAPKKLSVTWASDVYDPIPTSVSHAPSDKNQQYRSGGKRYWKNKQKGGSKSGRGSNGKVKKQARRNSGNAGKFKPL